MLSFVVPKIVCRDVFGLDFLLLTWSVSFIVTAAITVGVLIFLHFIVAFVVIVVSTRTSGSGNGSRRGITFRSALECFQVNR